MEPEWYVKNTCFRGRGEVIGAMGVRGVVLGMLCACTCTCVGGGREVDKNNVKQVVVYVVLLNW